jgi:hypothetical protein
MTLDEFFKRIMDTHRVTHEGYSAWMAWRADWIQPPISDLNDPWHWPQHVNGYWRKGGFSSGRMWSRK